MIHSLRTYHDVLIVVPGKVWRAQQRDRDASHLYKQTVRTCMSPQHLLKHETLFEESHDVYIEAAKFDNLDAANAFITQMRVYIDALTDVYGGPDDIRVAH